jgi:hypothetical protein
MLGQKLQAPNDRRGKPDPDTTLKQAQARAAEQARNGLDKDVRRQAAQPVGNLQQTEGGTGEVIQARHDHPVTGAQVIAQPGQFGPIALRAAGVFLEQSHPADRDAGMADQSATRGQVKRAGGATTHGGSSSQKVTL